MSTIAILQELMEKLASKRNVEEVHPWQEFDMIRGMSTVSEGLCFDCLKGLVT